MSAPGHVAILGAGPAGLATAHELTTRGAEVTVLEANQFVGGLCRTVTHKGYRFDLGGHRWFTKNEDLNNWFRRLMGDELVMVDRVSRIYYQGKCFLYPVALSDVLRQSGPMTVLHAGMAFLWSVLVQSVRTVPPANMKEAYVAQFGTRLYEMFFRHYSKKVWGRPCEELSSDWVAQRSKGLTIWSLARESLLGNSGSVVSLLDRFMYPREGYGRIAERMAEDVRHRGGNVLLGARVTGVAYRGPGEFEVSYRRPDGEYTLRANDVVSTIPLGVLVDILIPSCSGDVSEAARSLTFRDLITVNLLLKRRQVSRDTWLYVQDENVLFGRLHEPKNWSAAMVPDDEHTSLVLECFCTRGDAVWEMSDEQIVRRCLSDLVDKLGFIRPEEFEDALVVRTTHAYPVYDLGYSAKVATILKFLRCFQGLHVVGRGGTFRYNNADHSIEMGLLLGRRVLGADVDYMAVNTEPEYHEIRSSETPLRDHFTDRPAHAGEALTPPAPSCHWRGSKANAAEALLRLGGAVRAGLKDGD